MLVPVLTELKKLNYVGCIKISNQKVLKEGIRNALRNVSYLIKDLIFQITTYNFRLRKKEQILI